MVQLDRRKIAQQKLNQKHAKTANTLLNFITKKQSVQEPKQTEEKDYEAGIVKDPKDIFMNQESDYFKQAHTTLYMFRRHNKKEPLELRHQRTSDAFFTIGNDEHLDWKSIQCVYKMI